MLALVTILASFTITGCRSRPASQITTRDAAVGPPSSSAPPPLPIRIEEPSGYPSDPALLAVPLRQDLVDVKLERAGQRFVLRLGGHEGGDGPELRDLDLRPFIPRVPPIARGEETLTRIALFQRELNRNETRYESAGGEVKVANNCLRQGLWEVMLAEHSDGGMATRYHGWFTFPEAEYARLFEEVNGVAYARFRDLLVAYPKMDGFPVPLGALRTVEREIPRRPLDAHAREPLIRLPEQERKAKLVLTKGLTTFGDFADAGKQPIVTAKFTEPGFYDVKDPMRFDLGWLAHPTGLIVRRVKNPRVPAGLDELEVDFEGGRRLLLGTSRLTSLPIHREPPHTEKEVRRITFGIGTPDIYASAAERKKAYEEEPSEYLMLIDAHGDHVDNHTAGLDRVYLWRDAASLHLYLVGYERIALVGHYSAAWPNLD